MRRRTVVSGLGVAAALWASAVVGQTRPEAVLVRCAVQAGAPCLLATVPLSVEQMREAATAGGVMGFDWRGRFLGDTGLVGAGRRSRYLDEGRSNRVLVLVDVSGSMRSARFATTRWVVRDFLRALDSLPAGTARVAVAPFGSLGVADGIRRAAFTTPDSASAQVDELRDPDRENTGLFTAIEVGTNRLTEELRQSGSTGLGALVVITDGDNDVRPGDDPDLLAGADGLARAARTVDQSGVVVSIVGIGNLNVQALRSLAGSRGRMTLVREDPFEMARPLAAIRDLLWSAWDVAVPVAAAREELGRSLLPVGLSASKPGAALQTGGATWVPPVMALPAFVGVLPADLAPAGGEVEAAFDGRPLLALMVLVLLVMVWAVVPRILWPPVRPAPVAGARPEKAPPPPGSLRLDVKEVAPRRPTDITAARARRR